MRPLYNHPLPSKRNGEQQLTNTPKSVFITIEITWNHLFPDRFLVFPKGFHAFTLAETRVSFGGNLTETCKKVVRFRRNRSDGNTGKRNVSANGNMWLRSCFRYCFTCLRHVSVYGFLKFRPEWVTKLRSLMKKVIQNSNVCKRYLEKPISLPRMRQL